MARAPELDAPVCGAIQSADGHLSLSGTNIGGATLEPRTDRFVRGFALDTTHGAAR
jgi:hypothetical protein